MAQQKVKVKTGMNGTGKGRWCKRDVAKQASNVKRRQEDKSVVEADRDYGINVDQESVRIAFGASKEEWYK